MNIRMIEKEGEKAALVEADGVVLKTVDDAMDLMADVGYSHECRNIAIHEDAINQDFFDLRTGLAGEILQKYTNYMVRFAIIGDFEKYESKALRDFIYESNKGKQVHFAANEDEALAWLLGEGK